MEMKSNVPVEVIKGALTWAPGRVGTVQGEIDALSLCAREDGTGTEYNVEHYPVKACGRAFGPLNLEQTLRFCRALHRQLESPLRTATGLCLTTEPGSQAARMNAAVLLGAYLILMRNWAAQDVSSVLGAQEAGHRFPCSWSPPESSSKDDVMTVKHCWQGLEAAKMYRWVDPACIEDDICMSFACGQYSYWLSTYDAAWIAPGSILVCADPVTTALDPNPSTFTKLWPEPDLHEVQEGSDLEPISPLEAFSPCTPKWGGTSAQHELLQGSEPMSPSTPSWRCSAAPLRKQRSDKMSHGLVQESPRVMQPCSSLGVTASVPAGRPEALPTNRMDAIDTQGTSASYMQRRPPPIVISQPGYNPSPASLLPIELSSSKIQDRSPSHGSCRQVDKASSNGDSIISVCKAYTTRKTDGNHKADSSGEKATPFFEFMRDQSVSVIVRANFQDEPGMPGQSYQVAGLEAAGVKHLDVPLLDVRGGVHPPEDISKVLDVCIPHLEGSAAVAVHCKSGFGRSVVLACCLAIEQFDISGEDLLGWVRIARPGALNTLAQETAPT
eukprot:TRINITY_DN4077_c0_g2_i1.p1 TRINITY_DN4077_c0_g2~~TRINITY_DN4077_c0_g2_i1.p1  ORF type:complete len:564 (-),score=89.72 TRINITY_DN4077_c0_g2_i1:126-1790(-)